MLITSLIILRKNISKSLLKKSKLLLIINEVFRYNEFSLYGSLPIYTNNMTLHLLENRSLYEDIKFITKTGGLDAVSAIMKTPVLQSLKNTTKQYDLIITHIFGSDALLGFGYLFNAPVISYVTSFAFPWLNDRVGNPDNPSYIPNYFSHFNPKMSLFERIQNTILWITTRFL